MGSFSGHEDKNIHATGKLVAETDMQGDYTATQVVVRTIFEASRLHHVAQLSLAGMHTDGLGKVTIAFRIVGN
jgi:hypothetical protein